MLMLSRRTNFRKEKEILLRKKKDKLRQDSSKSTCNRSQNQFQPKSKKEEI
jgi:hypothetical protein